MQNTVTRLAAHSKTEGLRRPAKAPISAAVFFALYGVPHPASAQQQTESPSGTLQEITVTATRRAQTLEEVPYSITAIGAAPVTMQNNTCGKPRALRASPCTGSTTVEPSMTTSLSSIGAPRGNAAWGEGTVQRNRSTRVEAWWAVY